MAAATTSHNFTWNEQYRSELSRDFKPYGCNIKPARTIRPNGSFPLLTRSVSFGSPTFPRRKPSPIRRRKSKSVHFADTKGLDLVSVLTFNEEQELREQFSSCSQSTAAGQWRTKTNCELTQCKTKKSNEKRPSTKTIKQLAWQKVCVEKIELLKSAIRGNVYVVNLAFEKQVKARYSFDSWQTQHEIDAQFHSGCTQDIDWFVFEIPVQPQERAVKKFKVEFAVSYTVLGDTYWDNNNGFNYHVLSAK